MKSKIVFYAVVLLSVLVLACQMPAGFGPQRNLTGEEGENPSGAQGMYGLLAVVMDEARGQAVYINETGVRFDVNAEEYPGGPVIRCVQVEAFTEIPPSDDPEALKIKAIVAGTRDDGTLGAWEIHQDDSIHLTVGEDGQARCLTGADPTSVLDGMQTRFGWVYHVVGSATDGKIMIIAGYMENPKGFTYGSVQVLPGTTVGVYWKVWRLPYARFCIVSPPRIIGTWEKPVVPAGWPQGHTISAILAQLKLFFHGRLESYLVMVTAVSYDPQANVYLVPGTDQDKQPALAKIDKNGGIVIESTPPDLDVTSSSVTRKGAPLNDGDTVGIADELYIRAVVQNVGKGPAEASKLDVQIIRIDPLDGSAAWSYQIPTIDVPRLLPDKPPVTYDRGPYTVEGLAGAAGSYKIVVTDNGDPEVKELRSDNNSKQFSITVESGEPPKLEITELSSPTVAIWPAVKWELGAKVKNLGSVPVSLNLEYWLCSDDNFASAVKKQITTVSIIDLGAGSIYNDEPRQVPSVSDLLEKDPNLSGGTWYVIAVAGTATASVQLKVYYETVVIDTYDPVGPKVGFTYMDLFGPAGDTPIGDPPLPEYDVWSTLSSSTAALAWDNGEFAPDSQHLNFANIKYTGGVEPGVYYYVRIRGENKTDVGAYAIRLLTVVPDPNVPRDPAVWYFQSLDTTYTGAPVKGGQGKPASVLDLPLNGKLGRYIKADEVDWVRFILP